MNRLLAILAFVFVAAAHAQQGPASSPASLKCGVFPVALYDFQVINQAFSTSFYLWCTSKTADPKISGSMEIVNALSYEPKFADQSFKNGVYLTTMRYFAKVYHEWDMTNFPFDRQTLKVHLEDGVSDISELGFVADAQNSVAADDLILNGWKLESFKLTSAPHHYASGFGSAADQSSYSRMTLTFDIKRQGWRNFINYFLGFFVAVALCAFACFISTDRFSFILAGIFALIGNKYVLDQMLPATASFTLSDHLQIASFIFVLATSLFVALDSRAAHPSGVERFRYFTPTMTVVGLALYLIYVCVYVGLAVVS